MIDRAWNAIAANRAALQLVEALPAEVLRQRVNVFRLCLHPDGLAAVTRNFEDWSAYLLGQLHRAAVSYCPGRDVIDWRAIAEHFAPSRQLITAHTSTGAAFYTVRVSARKGS